MTPTVEFAQGDQWKAEVRLKGDVELNHLGFKRSNLIVPEEVVKKVCSKRNLICGQRLGILKLCPDAGGNVTVDGKQITEEKPFVEEIDASIEIKRR